MDSSDKPAAAATAVVDSVPVSPLNPTVFGPWLWTLLHAIAFAYAPSKDAHEASLDAAAAIDVVEGIGFLMVCSKCHSHLQKDLQEHSIAPHVFERKSFVQWTVDLHNRVNARLHKPQVSFAEAEKRFGGTCACARPKPADAPANSTDRELQDLAAYWKALLALAFGFPIDPSPAQQEAARSFLKAVLRLFPCSACRPALQQYAATMPATPIASSQSFIDEVRSAFSVVQNRTLGNGFKLTMEEMVLEFDGAGCGDCSIDALLKAHPIDAIPPTEAAVSKTTVASTALSPFPSPSPSYLPSPAPSSPPVPAKDPVSAKVPIQAPPAKVPAPVPATVPVPVPVSAPAPVSPPAVASSSVATIAPTAPTRADADKAAAIFAAKADQAYYFRITAIGASIIALVVLLWLLFRSFRNSAKNRATNAKPVANPASAPSSASTSTGVLAQGGKPNLTGGSVASAQRSQSHRPAQIQLQSQGRGYGQSQSHSQSQSQKQRQNQGWERGQAHSHPHVQPQPQPQPQPPTYSRFRFQPVYR